MNREKQLIRNTFILALGKICTQFISFFLLPLYTAYLSTSEYGVVDLLNNYVSLFIPIIFFQIDQALFRFLIDARDNDKSKEEIVSTTFITVSFQSIIFLIFYFFISFFIQNEYKYYLMITVIVSMYSNLFLQLCRGLGDNTSYSIGSVITGITTICLNLILIVIFKLGAYGMLIATICGNLFCILFLIFKMKIYKLISFKNYNKIKRKELWKYSIPLIPNQLSWWIVNVSDRTLIVTFIDMAANGIYSAANKFSSICNIVFNFFNLTWSESASMHVNDEDKDEFFSKIFNVSLGIFVPMCIGIIAVMPFVFNLLITGESFSDAYFQIPILMISTIFNIIVTLIGAVYIALKKSKDISKTSIYAAIINILINFLFIKKIGLFAASISTFISYLAMSIYRFIDVQKYVKIRLNKKLIILSLIMILITLPFYYIRNLYLCFISFIVCLLISIFINKNLIFLVFDIIKKKLQK